MIFIEKLKEDIRVGGEIGKQIFNLRESFADRPTGVDFDRFLEKKVENIRENDMAVGLPTSRAIGPTYEKYLRLLVRQITETATECSCFISLRIKNLN